MKLKGFKRRLAAAGIDASFIRRCDITCQQGTGVHGKRMVVVLDSYAADPDGRRFLVFDGATGERTVAAERRVIDLDVFLAAVSR